MPGLLPDAPGAGAAPRAVAAAEFGSRPGIPAWVEPSTCASCHESQAFAHRQSHHGRAMELASESSVLGNFDDARLDDGTRFLRDGKRFVVETAGADGNPQRFEVAFTFGVDPLQQYLVTAPGGRLSALGAAWDTLAGRWFALPSHDEARPGDAYHWTGAQFNANAMCVTCHTTAYTKGYDPDADTYASTWLEAGVGCQACHGPGAGHLDWVRAGAPATDVRAGFVLDPAASDQAEQCARCHSRRRHVLPEEQVGGPLMDQYSPTLLEAGLYHADGQILDEVFVYGSFAQSAMHRAGVRCGDCHDPHGLGLRVPGNAVCTQCHNAEREDPRFPTLPLGDFDDRSHHGHEPGSPGGNCVDCHMPARTYMELDPRRDHRLAVPRPDLSARLGVPNACTGCHAERTPGWAVDSIRSWAADAGRETAMGSAHFAEVISAARSGDASVDALAALSEDEEQAVIVRATALSLLASSAPRQPGSAEAERLFDVVRAAAASSDPMLRAAAAEALDTLPMDRAHDLGLRLLTDSVRAVRVEAARRLGPQAAEPGDAIAQGAWDELVAVERSLTDLPDGAFRMGLMAVRLGEVDAAESAWRRALQFDNRFLPARANLVQLMDAQGRPADAEALLREGLSLDPGEGELWYSLGLLLAQQERLAEAAPALQRATDLLPDRSRVAYNLGLALLRLDSKAQAELALLEAVARDPAAPEPRDVLLGMFLERDDRVSALVHAQALLKLFPQDAQLTQLVTDLTKP